MITDYKDTVQMSTYKIFVLMPTVVDKLECKDAFPLGWNVQERSNLISLLLNH